jgi:hypothetical protein
MSSDLFALNATTLKHLDCGKAAVALNLAITKAVKDCIDRPSDDRERKVTLSLAIKPVKEVVDNVISCEGASGAYKVQCAIPPWESQKLDFGVRENGMLVFSEHSPHNHRQVSFLDGSEEEEA